MVFPKVFPAANTTEKRMNAEAGLYEALSPSGFVFFTTTTITLILFVRAAKQWKHFLEFWTHKEAPVLESVSSIPSTTWTLKFKIRLLTAVIMFSALLENSHSLLWNYYQTKQSLISCNVTSTEVRFEHFVKVHGTHSFLLFGYSLPLGIWYLWGNTCQTFTWTFLDLLLSILSVAIAHLFTKVFERAIKSRRDDPERFWRSVRTDFVGIVELLEETDRLLAPIILLSLGSDLYFICLQLFRATINDATVFNLYFVYSVISTLFLLGRTLTMLLCAASIHTASLKLLPYMKYIPSDEWGLEVRRLHVLLRREKITLTGARMFRITRGLILAIASYVVTYEFLLRNSRDDGGEFASHESYCEYLVD